MTATARRSFVASRSHAYRRWRDANPNADSQQTFYDAFTEAWQDRQAAIDRLLDHMTEMSARIHRLERQA